MSIDKNKTKEITKTLSITLTKAALRMLFLTTQVAENLLPSSHLANVISLPAQKRQMESFACLYQLQLRKYTFKILAQDLLDSNDDDDDGDTVIGG